MEATISIGALLANVALTLLDAIFTIFEGWVQWDGLEQAYNVIFDILEVVCYFLPMGTISAIFTITILLLNAKLIISILKLLWDILPVL